MHGVDELVGRLVQRWSRLERMAPEGQNVVKWISDSTGTPFKTVDFVRRCRNDCAHNDLPLDRLEGALAVADDLVAKMDSLDRTRAVLVRCGGCGTRNRVPRKHLGQGKTVRCGSCGKLMNVKGQR